MPHQLTPDYFELNLCWHFEKMPFAEGISLVQEHNIPLFGCGFSNTTPRGVLAWRRVTRNPFHNDYCLFRSPLDGNNTTFMESTEWSRNGLNSARFLAPSIPLSSTSMGYGLKNGEYYILYKILWKEPLMYTPAILRGWKASRGVAQTRRMEFSQS